MADGGCGRGKALVVLALCLVLGSCSVGNSDVELSAVEAPDRAAVAPVPSPTQAPEPTVEPIATPTVQPTVQPTPTPSETDIEFAALARSATDVLLDRDFVVVQFSHVQQTPGNDGEGRFEAFLRIDRPAQRGQLSDRWVEADGSVSRDAAVVFDGLDVYVRRADPTGKTESWRVMSRADFPRGDLNDPSRLANAMTELLATSSPVQIVAPNRVRVLVPHSALFWYLPSLFIEILLEQGVNPELLTHSTPVGLEFEDGALTKVHVQYGALLDDAGLPESVIGGMLYATLKFSYPEDASIDLPPSELLIDQGELSESTDFPPSVYFVGGCYRKRDVAAPLIRVVALPCTEPHGAEVYEIRQLPGALGVPFPGDDDVLGRADQICAQSLRRLYGAASDLSVHPWAFFYPSEISWDAGDRSVTCFVEFDEDVDVALADVDLLRSSTAVSTYALRTGDCITDKSLEGLSYSLVDCDSPHFFEVYHVVDLPDGDFPGDTETVRLADEACLAAFETAIGEPYEKSDWTIEPLSPNELTWDTYDDRLVACLITTYGSVEGSAVVGAN